MLYVESFVVIIYQCVSYKAKSELIRLKRSPMVFTISPTPLTIFVLQTIWIQSSNFISERAQLLGSCGVHSGILGKHIGSEVV